MSKMLTPSDMQKLPYCKHDFFGKCSSDQVNFEHCLTCTFQMTFKALQHDDIGTAMHGLDTLVKLLQQNQVLPKEAKP